MNRITRRDWALLIIAAAQGQPLTPVQLQKTVFLLGQERSQAVGSDFYEFAPYDYGPFCVDVYRDAETLEAEGYITIQLHETGRWKEYKATLTGILHADELKKQIPGEVSDYISSKVQWARGKSFQQLVRAIYQQFPEYRVNSVFQGQ